MLINIIVCVKQVPDIGEMIFFYDKGNLVAKSCNYVMNGDDACALEEALRIKDMCKDAHITVITMGTGKSENVLTECLAMGADDGVLISDEALAEADTFVTSEVLAAAVKKAGNYDLIFAGRQTVDSGTAQVGPQLAEKLKMLQLTNVVSLEIEKDYKSIKAKRALENTYETVRLKIPCLLTVSNECNKPRVMSVRGILEAHSKDVRVWTLKDLDLHENITGPDASPAKILRTFMPSHKNKPRVICMDDENQAAQELIKQFKRKYII